MDTSIDREKVKAAALDAWEAIDYILMLADCWPARRFEQEALTGLSRAAGNLAAAWWRMRLTPDLRELLAAAAFRAGTAPARLPGMRDRESATGAIESLANTLLNNLAISLPWPAWLRALEEGFPKGPPGAPHIGTEVHTTEKACGWVLEWRGCGMRAAAASLPAAVEMEFAALSGSQVEDGPWSTPQSPTEWAAEFGYRTARAFVDKVDKGTIRAKKLSPKLYQVRLSDLPKPRQR